ncbi:ATP-binding protein [Pseudomonas aeruginosa]
MSTAIAPAPSADYEAREALFAANCEHREADPRREDRETTKRKRAEIEIFPRQENGRFRGLILSGPPGIGKTHTLMGMAEEANVKMARLPMAARTKEEFGVYLYPDKNPETGEITIEQPMIEKQLIPFLKKNIGNKYAIVIFDDLTLADPRLQSTFLEMVQFGRIGGEELGDNVLLAFTGNGIEDGCNAVEWNRALLGRSMYIEFKPDFDTWADLPCNAMMDPWIKSFLYSDTNRKFWCPTGEAVEKCADPSGKVASPRDWTGLGNDITKAHGGVASYKGGMLFPTFDAYMSSYASSLSAKAFKIFADVLIKYPTAEAIYNDPDEWKRVDHALKANKGGVYAVIDGLKQYAWRRYQKIEETTGKGKARDKAMREHAIKVAEAISEVMMENREMGAFSCRWLIKQVLEAHPEGDCEFGAALADMAFGAEDNSDRQKLAGFDKIMDAVDRMTNIITNSGTLDSAKSKQPEESALEA